MAQDPWRFSTSSEPVVGVQVRATDSSRRYADNGVCLVLDGRHGYVGDSDVVRMPLPEDSTHSGVHDGHGKLNEEAEKRVVPWSLSSNVLWFLYIPFSLVRATRPIDSHEIMARSDTTKCITS